VSELHYTYRVEWSPEDDEWVGLVAEFPSLSWLDRDPVEAMRGVRDLVEGVVEDMRESGEVPPAPLADRRYSGKVFVRTSPELHRRLTIEAAEQGVSVNQWAVQKLAQRSGDPSHELAGAAVFGPLNTRSWLLTGHLSDLFEQNPVACQDLLKNFAENWLVLVNKHERDCAMHREKQPNDTVHQSGHPTTLGR